MPFLERLLAFARTLQPDIAKALIRAIHELAHGYMESAVADAIQRGDLNGAVSIIMAQAAIAFVPVRESIRTSLVRSALYVFRDTPKGQPFTGQVTAVVRFNTLDPMVAQAAQAFETPILNAMTADIRDGILAAIRQGVIDGVNPRTIARDLRSAVGLSPSQEQYVANYQAELEALSKAAMGRRLTDGRFDKTVSGAIKAGKALTSAQIDKYVTAYRKNLLAHQAETLSRTIANNALREGQRLAWKQAIKTGKVKAEDLIDTWHTTLDGRERPRHHEMNGRTKSFNEPWIVPGVGPQDYPGQSEFNCRCCVFTRPRVRRASAIAQGAA